MAVVQLLRERGVQHGHRADRVLRRARRPCGALLIVAGNERHVPPIARCLGIARNATKANVFLIVRSDGPVVRKEVLDEGGGLLPALGRFLLRRETAMLRLLEPTGLCPRVLASGPTWMETEFVDGETVASRRRLGIDESEATRLRAALDRLHATGFAHGDLGRRDILLAKHGRVVILDVATAVGPGCPPVLGRLLLGWARRRDRYRLEETIRKGLEHRAAAVGRG